MSFWEKCKQKHVERLAAARAARAEAKKAAAAPEKTLWLAVGLGNFGPEYADTRHNCGFRALDRLADKLNAGAPKHRFKGVVREAEHGAAKLILLWPYTYMNASGESIAEALNWYKLPEERMIVIYDDSDLEVGAIRVRAKGSAGTHNGMKSVLSYTNTDSFPRIRVGIGKKPVLMDMKDFVLGRFREEERGTVAAAEEKAAEAVLSVVDNGCEKTMSAFNSPHSGKTAPEKAAAKAEETAGTAGDNG